MSVTKLLPSNASFNQRGSQWIMTKLGSANYRKILQRKIVNVLANAGLKFWIQIKIIGY